jgi:hypothetical protein
MVDVNDIYKTNSDNIKAEDIGNNMWTLTIKTADVKEFKNKEGQSERKIVLTFAEWEKSLPLNKTNAQSIAGMYGHNSNAWPGNRVMLFTMMVDFGGKPTLGIRVRAPMQPGGPTQPGTPHQQAAPQRPLNQPQQQTPPPNFVQPVGPREFAPLEDEEIPF